MKVLSNKKGSALLWCILLIIILTILLSSVLTAVYTYYNYTMRTVKRQQAYFTARSAANVILEQLTSQEQVRKDGIVSEYEESNIPILPEEGKTVEITSFGFAEELGDVTATLDRNQEDEIKVEVTSYYPDKENGEKYVLKATVVRQPLYFGGIAVKKLDIAPGKTLTLGDNTDLYWNNDNVFNTGANTTDFANGNGSGKIVINGNLVTKGDAIITQNNVVAGRKFYGSAEFSVKPGSIRSKKIWSPTEYIISNKTLTVADEEATEYTSTTVNTLKRLSNGTTNYAYCNSNGKDGAFGLVDFGGAFEDLGINIPLVSPNTIVTALKNLPLVGNLITDAEKNNLKIEEHGNDATAIKYIKLISPTQTLTQGYNDMIDGLLSGFPNIFGSRDAVKEALTGPINRLANAFGRTCLDVSYIDYSESNRNSYADKGIVPLTYIFLDGGNSIAEKMRVRYGSDPGNASLIYRITDSIRDSAQSLINTVFGTANTPNYLVVYVEENGKVELGYNGDNLRNSNYRTLSGGKEFKGSPSSVFMYSIYGGPGTEVVIWDDVIVVGEIICDKLTVKGDAKVIFSSVSGGQVAKQKVAEYWAVSNYTD